MQNEGAYYITIPGYIRADKRLSAYAKLLYGEIAAKCNVTGFCWATNRFFGDVFGVNIRSIQRYMQELLDLKYIDIEFVEEKRIIHLTEAKATRLSRPTTTPRKTHDAAVREVHDKTVEQIKLSKNNKKNRNTVAGAAPRPAKVARKKKEKPATQVPDPSGKTKTLYAEFIDIYDIWYKGFNDGTPPKYDKGNGNAAKSLLAHFQRIAKAKAEQKGLTPDQAEIDRLALDGWRRVLDSWPLLDAFMRGKTRLLDINSNIQNIIHAIKNANTSGKPGPPQQVNKNDIGMHNLLKRIRQGEAAGPDATADGRAVG